MTFSTDLGPNMNVSEPNTQILDNSYKKAYDWLFSQLTSDTQTKVLAAKGSDKVAPPEVVEFIKKVIELAERGS
jgi:hypothetical protein